MSGVLALRADAGVAVGAGHVMRCLALGQAWSRLGGRALLITGDAPSPLDARLLAAGLEIERIAGPLGGPADAGATAAAALRAGAGWIVVDGYGFDAGYHTALRAQGLAVLALDDGGQVSEHAADIVLDQNIGATALPYRRLAPHTRLLLGPRFALFRDDVLAAAAAERPPAAPVARRILVTLGGSDPEGAALGVIEALERTELQGRTVEIVAGPHCRHVDELVTAARRARHLAAVVRDVHDLPQRMLAADLAIVAAGGTAREAALLGLPTLTLTIAKNQRAAAAALADAGIALDLGCIGAFEPAAAALEISALARDPGRRTAMAAAGRAAFDGRGAERVLAALAAPVEAAA